MRKEEKEQLLLKDLSLRLPYGVEVFIENAEVYGDEPIQKVTGIWLSNKGWQIDCLGTSIPILNIKPLLIPFSKITKEQRLELSEILGWDESELEKALACSELTNNVYLIRWFVKNHIDYDNLIGQGLALDIDYKNIIINREKIVSSELPVDIIKENEDTFQVVFGSDFEVEVGSDGSIKIIRKKPLLPKTYDECLKVLGLENVINDVTGYKQGTLSDLRELIIARNAWWKVLQFKPEELNSCKDDVVKYIICFERGRLRNIDTRDHINSLFVFPTSEIRDEFSEIWKEKLKSISDLLYCKI